MKEKQRQYPPYPDGNFDAEQSYHAQGAMSQLNYARRKAGLPEFKTICLYCHQGCEVDESYRLFKSEHRGRWPGRHLPDCPAREGSDAFPCGLSF